MRDSAVARTPYEIWEPILLEVIALVSPPFFDVSCTSSNYLEFKRLCGDGQSAVYRHEYDASEQDRRTMRLVCRSWRDIADRWDVRERWIRVDSLSSGKEMSDERWKGAQRVEFCGFSPANRVDLPQKMEAAKLCAVLSHWKAMGGISGKYGHGGINFRRLELLGSMDRCFDDVLDALCDASTSLTCLRSLTLYIPSSYGQPLQRLSKHFPDLVHLTLHTRRQPQGDYGDYDEPGTNPYADSLALKNLEVLLAIPLPDNLWMTPADAFKFSAWSLPSLRHFHAGVDTPGLWGIRVFPFLKRHASTIETIDLDNTEQVRNRGHRHTFDPSKVDFWGTFPRLKLLRCDISRTTLKSPPPEHHPIEWFVNSKSVDSEDQFISTVSLWAQDGTQVKRLKHLVVFGSYLSSGMYKQDGAPVQGMLRRLQLNGTMLEDPAGRSWLGVS